MTASPRVRTSTISLVGSFSLVTLPVSDWEYRTLGRSWLNSGEGSLGPSLKAYASKIVRKIGYCKVGIFHFGPRILLQFKENKEDGPHEIVTALPFIRY